MRTTRTAKIAELIASLGVNQTLLLELRHSDGFVRVDAMPNGVLRLRMGENGGVDITFSRDQTHELVDSLQLEEALSMGLQHTLQDGAGRLLFEGQGAASSETPDQVANLTEVPLTERVGRYLSQFEFTARAQSDALATGPWLLDYRGVGLEILVFEKDELIELRVEIAIEREGDRELAAERFPAVASPLILFFEGDEGRSLMCVIRLPGVPFIGQHLGRAIEDLMKTIDIWKQITEGEME